MERGPLRSVAGRLFLVFAAFAVGLVGVLFGPCLGARVEIRSRFYFMATGALLVSGISEGLTVTATMDRVGWENLQILDSVVHPVPVDMVDDLLRAQRPANVLFHDVTVSENAAPIDSHSNIPIPVNASSLVPPVRCACRASGVLDALTFSRTGRPWVNLRREAVKQGLAYGTHKAHTANIYGRVRMSTHVQAVISAGAAKMGDRPR